MASYRSLVPLDPSIISSYGEKPMFHLAGGQACADVAAALLALVQELPWLRVTDCFREVSVQVALRKRYDTWVAAGKPKAGSAGWNAKTMKDAFVAIPGKSMHNAGRAVDLNTEVMQKNLGKEYLDAFWPIATKHGFSHIIAKPTEGASESWHYDHHGDWDRVFSHLGYEQGALCAALDVGQAGAFQSDAALVQALLLRAGYDIGAVDGQLGKRSYTALAMALAPGRYPPDGKVTDQVIEDLRALPPLVTGDWKVVS